MAFPESVVEEAWQRSGGRCECTRVTHGHSIPCSSILSKYNRGREGGGEWEALHRVSGGFDTLSNCHILCWDCHSKTL